MGQFWSPVEGTSVSARVSAGQVTALFSTPAEGLPVAGGQLEGTGCHRAVKILHCLLMPLDFILWLLKVFGER
jgi:hypothetical protein